MSVRTVSPENEFKDQARVLASAFRTDPVFLYFFGPGVPDILEYNKKLFSVWLKFMARKPKGRVVLHTSQGGESVALWLPGGGERSTIFELVVLAFASLFLMGWSGTVRFMTILNSMEKCRPAERHAYLASIGTEEGSRGKGTGSLVIREMLRTLDREKVPAYLESSNPKNIPFYERHGFRVTGYVPAPKDAPPLAKMWRAPQ